MALETLHRRAEQLPALRHTLQKHLPSLLGSSNVAVQASTLHLLTGALVSQTDEAAGECL